MGRWFVLLALVACGRIDFDPLERCRFRSVALGESSTCALGSNGSVWCWGNNDLGQVGLPRSGNVLGGARVPLPGPAVEIGAGVVSACARLDDDTIWCWGDNDQGQLGTGSLTAVEGPVQVGLGGDVPVELEVGGRFACIRRASDSSLVCWGGGRHYLLGDMPPDPRERVPHPTPVIIAGTAGTKSFTLGHRHGCGFDASDQVFCWGKGEDGQLGVGMANSATPVQPTGLAPVQEVNATNRVTCVVFAGGGVRCWGARYLGGASFDQYPPTVYVADGVAVGTSNYAGCAVHPDATVSCWGYLYDQIPTPVDNTPTPLGLGDIASIEGGWYHYCAFTKAGELVCWGSDTHGQLGRGDLDSDPRPAPVAIECD